MKRCNHCFESKPLADFPPDKQNRDGRKGKCRSCVLARQRELRAENPDRERNWVQRNHDRVLRSKRGYRDRNEDRLRVESRQRARRARATPEGAERSREIARNHYQRNRDVILDRDRIRRATEPEKARARDALNGAIRRGRIKKPSRCEECGAHRKLHGHHHDYSKPLDVEWLCPPCHARRHSVEPQEIADGKAKVMQ